MSAAEAFELIREEQIDEVNALARYYRHKKTGAEVISLINDDENKVFGIAFATPPEDSTGIAHILEHSVLCGSEQFQVKKPFVEMLKGSLHTFLNAMTFPDKTVYPVASQNLADFHNLTEVYLDAVLFPLLTRETFEQEGWHYELENPETPLIYKGVVFNEMKGGYSSPDQVLGTYAQNALFPDNTYGFSSGGDPKVMPELTYEKFAAFHKRYYHPSNAQIIFYGDDDPDQRLEILEKYLSRFDKAERAPIVPIQPKFDAPRYEVRTYPADEENRRSAFVMLNWLVEEPHDHTEALRRHVLAHALLGNSAAPLHKALTESGLGESVIGGLHDQYREPWFNVGLRNADADTADQIEALILDTLASLAEHGIDKATVESTVNSIEFSLREMNTGRYPRGIMYFFSALGDWLYGKDPLEALKYEDALATLKAELAAGTPILEDRIRTLLLDNTHRVTLVLKADKEQAEREEAAERAKLDAVRAGLSEEDVAGIIATTQKLKALQNAPDKPENLAKIPTLTLDDLDREIKTVPSEELALSKVRTLYHDLPTNGIVYFDLGFDLKALPRELIPYLPIFSRALTQTGTSTADYVALSQRIGRSTGGIGVSRFSSSLVDGAGSTAMLMVRGKAMADKSEELLAIAHDVLTDARLDNRDRIRQLVAQDKARLEAGLVPSGHMMAFSRLQSTMTEADWLSEQCSGISQLFFLRELAQRVENDWESVEEALTAIREHVMNATTAIANVTADADAWTQFQPRLEGFLAGLPTHPAILADWGDVPAPKNEGLTIPAQVNYVAKGVDLKKLGYNPSGALSVVTKYLGTTYLWDKIRVEGGAYGGFARFDSTSGIYAFGSYRDPNLTATLDVYDKTPDKLREEISDADVTRSIIGTIGDLDAYQLPDAKGFTELVRTLTGATEAYRQKRRDQVLATSKADFREAADLLEEVTRNGHVVAIGSESAINKANAERNGFLDVTKVL